MSKLYLHKIKNSIIHTSKEIIVADMVKLNKRYEYKDNILKKHPKILKITNACYMDFLDNIVRLRNFPVKKIIIDGNIICDINRLFSFYNTTELEISSSSKIINIKNNLNLTKLEYIKFPFTVDKFSNKKIYNNKIKTITIYNNEDSYTIELDENLLDREISIYAINNNNKLNINITSNNIDIEYTVYLENNKLTSIKKYNKFEINAKDDEIEELNLIELKKLYNDITFTGKYYYVRKLTLDKSNIHLLTKDIFNNLNLKEIIIKDDNEMSLLPRTINLNLNKDRLKKAEIYNNKLMINLETEDETNKYILINEDLSYIEFTRDDLCSIKKVYLDFNTTKFSLTKLDGGYSITIPFNINFDTKNSKILIYLIQCACELYVKTKDKEISIPKCNPDLISSIKRDEKEFYIEYYDSKERYNITGTNSMELLEKTANNESKKLKLTRK